MYSPIIPRKNNMIKKFYFFIKHRLLKEKINKIKLFKVRLPENEKKFPVLSYGKSKDIRIIRGARPAPNESQ